MFKNVNILKLFFERPSRRFNVREVARLVKISPATASKKLRSLAKAGILKQERERMLLFYRANLESDLYQDMKLFYNIRKIRESGLLDELNKFYFKPTVVLFGSASKGLDTESSDLDLLILSEKKVGFPQKEKFEKKLGKSLQLFVFKTIKKIKNKELINSIINGVVLQGELRWT